jgi:hypothetical protein
MSYTVYLTEPFSGTASTVLTSLADGFWPNDATHVGGSNAIEIDGTGWTFLSGTDSANITNQSMPSAGNFEVIFPFRRKSSLAGGQSAQLVLWSTWNTFAHPVVLMYSDGARALFSSGFSFASYVSSTNTPMGSANAGPSINVTWYVKVTVATTGGNTTFTAYYSTDGGVTYTDMGIAGTIATPASTLSVGLYYGANGNGGWTATTGPQIGQLIVQDPSATTATLSIASGSGPSGTPVELTVTLDLPAGSGGLTVPIAQTGGTGTLSSTSGGSTVSSITIAQGASSGTFWWNSSAAGTASITIGPTSPVLTLSGSPKSFTATDPSATYGLTGPSSGPIGVASSAFTLTPSGSITDTVTFADSPSGGTFTPTSLSWSSSSAAQTFTYTPATPGAKTLTLTSGASYAITGSPATYTATMVATSYTLAGPTAGVVNQSSTAFTVAPNGSFTGTISVSLLGAGLAGPIVLAWANSSTAQAFVITPLLVGSATLTPGNSGGLTDASPLGYIATAAPATWQRWSTVAGFAVGLATVEYQVITGSTGAVYSAWTTTGVVEQGGGSYGANVTLPSVGGYTILWRRSSTDSPPYATESTSATLLISSGNQGAGILLVDPQAGSVIIG